MRESRFRRGPCVGGLRTDAPCGPVQARQATPEELARGRARSRPRHYGDRR